MASSTIKAVAPDLVVAQDGSGKYRTLSEAVLASVEIRKGNTKRFVIQVKAGTYQEYVRITEAMPNLMLIGDGINLTKVTGSRNNKDTPRATLTDIATFAVFGDGFVARDMTFENTAGPIKNQAIAFASKSNHSAIYQCRFIGYQDTLYVKSGIQFYRNCFIYGTIDFIFGDAAVVFQKCQILIKNPTPGQDNVVTAQGRKNLNDRTGICIHDSVVAPAEMLRPSVQTFLGRPWEDYSRTVYIKTCMEKLIDPDGWTPWPKVDRSKTLYYGEYNNTGPGASTAQRVKWPGYHRLNESEAQAFTVGNFLSGDSWIPETGIPYDSGLLIRLLHYLLGRYICKYRLFI